jgi:ankyrin repeat protein
MTKHLDCLARDGEEIRREFESFIADLSKKHNSYACLLLGQWIEKLNWPRKLHINAHETAARLCVQKILAFAASTRNGQVAQALLALQTDLLHLESKAGHGNTIPLLLEMGADINAKDDRGRTPLSLAAKHGHEATVKLLLKMGAGVNVKDNYSYSPLSLAAKHGHEAIFRLLLKMGASVDCQGLTMKHII